MSDWASERIFNIATPPHAPTYAGHYVTWNLTDFSGEEGSAHASIKRRRGG